MKIKNEVKEQVQVKSEQNFSSGIYRKLKLKQIDTNANVNVNVNVPKKNVTWTDQKPINTNIENLSLLIEELSPIEEIEIEKKDKIDILTNKVDILIDLMTKLTKQLSQQGN